MRAAPRVIRVVAGWALGLGALAAAGLAGGCGGPSAEPGLGASEESGVIGAHVRLIMVKETDGARAGVSPLFSKVLGPLADKPAEGAWAETRERLRRAGIRAVVVERARLAEVESALGSTPAGTAVSLGQAARWTPVAVGGPLSEDAVVRVHDGLLTLGAGRLRLLLRCYIAPWGAASGGEVGAGLRVDVVPQHEAREERRSTFADSLEGPRVRSVEDAGQVLTSLALEAFLGPGEVLLLVPERPEARWEGGAVEGSPAGHGDTGPTPMEGPLPPERVEFSGVGPPPPRPKTVGELVLTDATDISDPSLRMIVVVDPILPKRYNLIPDAGPGGR